MNADRVAVYTRSEVQLERLNIENGSKQQRIGARGERLARLYLRLHGYRILQRNYRVAHKEIDIIAKKGSTVAFVEVKTALDSKELPPMLRVGSAKEQTWLTLQSILRQITGKRRLLIASIIIEVILSEHKIRHIGKCIYDLNKIKNPLRLFPGTFNFGVCNFFFAFGLKF